MEIIGGDEGKKLVPGLKVTGAFFMALILEGYTPAICFSYDKLWNLLIMAS
jgi:hypothetical protein